MGISFSFVLLIFFETWGEFVFFVLMFEIFAKGRGRVYVFSIFSNKLEILGELVVWKIF